jgi:cell division protein ZapA (FtsZ GTPase activity inhibitor)
VQVKITIRGRQYTVRGDEAGGDIQQIAHEVDARMSEVATHTRSFDEYTIALLTALNLASELQQLRRQVAGRLDDFDRDVASIAAMLEAVLPEDPEQEQESAKKDPG